jgi:signal transduction histidine kinase
VTDCTAILRQQAEMKGVKIVMVPLKHEMILNIDAVRVQQVVINFLSNAIKFSPEKSEIIVSVRSQLDVENKQYKITIKVTDQGIGMNETDVKNLLKPFFKSSDKANRDMNTQGHGLGLSICHVIA